MSAHPSASPDASAAVLVFGRDPSCDVVVDHPTVSSRHARLVLVRSGLVLEDLGSTNGTYLGGRRVDRARVERGADVRIGDVQLPWGDRRVQAFTRRASASGTVVMSQVALPAGAPAGSSAGASHGTRRLLGFLAGATLGLGLLGGGFFAYRQFGGESASASDGASTPAGAGSTQEAEGNDPASIVRRTRAAAIAAAIDPTAPVTRDTAVKLAAGEEGPFHVEQVARIWTHVRGRWRYVNDPHGAEYFAKASETIGNDYVGDCDDFAIVLTSMIGAIGGEARVVLMNSPEGGHAYAEACIRMDPNELSTRLATYYRRKWDPYLGRQRIERIHFRSSPDCPVWLNLDWSAGVPGGGYQNEQWAVAVSPSGETVALAPAVADAAATTPGAEARSGTSRTTTRR